MTDAGLTPAAGSHLIPTKPIALPGNPPIFNVRHFVLILLMFMPGLSTNFMSLVPIIAFLLLTMMRGIIRGSMVMLPVGLVALSLLITMLRDLTGVASVSTRDLTEVIRLLALLSTVALVLGATEAQFARRLLMAVVLTDLVLSLSQLKILPGAIASAFSRFYQSDFHVENALGISKRALGLFTDPTTHGLAMGLVALVFLGDTVTRKGRRGPVGLLAALLIVVLAQSQTAFIATVVGMATFFFVNLVTRPTLRGVTLLVALFGGAAALLLRFAEELKYLSLLFQVGLKRNSFHLRVLKRDDSLEIMHDEPIGMLLGWGKDYLGSTSAALDNEYLFVYLVYGLPGLVLFLVSLLAILIYAIRTQQHVLLAATMLGIFAAYPASFFTNLKTFTLYCLVISATIATNKLPVLRARLR
jgi:hypothetical protein